MLIDARALDPSDTRRFSGDVCVVGGGIAGITLARRLADAGTDVVLVESGGLSGDAATDGLQEGESVGVELDVGAHARSRFLGGGSNCWAGWSKPLEPHDFTVRSWVPDSGWPFGPDELAPHYERARGVLGLDLPLDDVGDVDEPEVLTSFSRFADVLRLGRAHRRELDEHPRITVLLHANLTEIRATPDGRHVTDVVARTLTGRSALVRARRFVLATGAIENARLLLAAGASLDVDHDLVGRYFADHPRRLCGEVRLRRPNGVDRLYERGHRGTGVVVDGRTVAAAALVVSPRVQERDGLLGARASLRSMAVGESTETVESLRRLRRLVRNRDGWGADHTAELVGVLRRPWLAVGFAGGRATGRRPFVRRTCLELIVEPSPDGESRVTLADERDALGMRRARVDWRLGEQVRHTFDRTAEILAGDLARRDVADVALTPTTAGWRDEVEGTWHHMGTTRMHRSPRSGVVDPDAKVHGVDNLYVAGSSVFPTVGANFPTLTLTALALRLADHLTSVDEWRA